MLYATTTGPYILQAAGLVGRFKSSPKETHMKEVKGIFKYLKGTLEFCLWFPKIEYFTLTAYTDADWAGSVDDKKNSSGGAFYLRKCLVSWLSKNKTSISLSTAEAQYIAVVSCCTQVIQMKQTLEDVHVKI